jgi:hypothetical protein
VNSSYRVKFCISKRSCCWSVFELNVSANKIFLKRFKTAIVSEANTWVSLSFYKVEAELNFFLQILQSKFSPSFMWLLNLVLLECLVANFTVKTSVNFWSVTFQFLVIRWFERTFAAFKFFDSDSMFCLRMKFKTFLLVNLPSQMLHWKSFKI